MVLPVHSETDSLVGITEALIRLLPGDLHEILFIVSPRSPGETFSIVESLGRRYPLVRWERQRENPGLGLAVRQGLGAVTGTHVLMMDGDGEMDTATVPALAARMRETRCDMVVASRWIPGGGAEGYDPLKRVLNRGFQMIFRRLFGTPIHDLTFGFKLMKVSDARRVRWTVRFHDIAAETTLRPIRLGLRVEEVPTVWRRRQAGVSKNPFRRNFLYVRRALGILLRRPALVP